MFHGWENFYMMAGTAAATLAGLMFVVITLCASLASTPAEHGVHAFVTPVLVHFGGVLFLSLFLLAPWPWAWPVGLFLGLIGLTGIVYAVVVIRLLWKLDFVALRPADWISYGGASALPNVALIVGAAGLVTGKVFTPYVVAAAVTMLLFIGIFDAWDLTLWIVKNSAPGKDRPDADGGDLRA
jgi:hypothetical protein